MRDRRSSTPRLGVYLVLLTLAAVVPVSLLAAYFLYRLARSEEQRLEDYVSAKVGQVVAALDRDLNAIVGAAEVLAELPEVRTGDFEKLRDRVKTVGDRLGVNIVVRDPAGNHLFNILLPEGEKARTTLPEDDVVRATMRPVITNLFTGSAVREPFVSVVAPVRGPEGDLRYLMNATIRPTRILSAIQATVLPGTLAAVSDANGTVVARTIEHERYVGKPGVPQIVAAMNEAAEGSWTGPGLDGNSVRLRFARLSLVPWSVGVAVTEAEFRAPLRTAARQVALLIAAALLGALGLAWLVGRRILAPVQTLLDDASTIAAGSPLVDRVLPIGELNRVHQELVEASRQIGFRSQDAEDARRLLNGLMRYLPEGITVAKPPDVTIVRVSEFGQKLVARDPGEIENITQEQHLKAWGLSRPDGRPCAEDGSDLPLTRATLTGEVVEDEEWVITTPDGRSIPILCNAGPIRDASGRITEGIIAWRDMTRLKGLMQDLEKERDTNALLLRELSHRTMNAFTIMAGLLHLQSRSTQGAARDALAAAATRINSMGALYRRLTHSGEEMVGTDQVDGGALLGELASEVRQAFLGDRFGSLTWDVAPDFVLPARDATSVALIVNELLTNSVKYANSAGPVIQLKAMCRPDSYQVSVTDNGDGFSSEAAAESKSLGMKAVRALLTGLGGRMKVFREGDMTVVTIEWPLVRDGLGSP